MLKDLSKDLGTGNGASSGSGYGASSGCHVNILVSIDKAPCDSPEISCKHQLFHDVDIRDVRCELISLENP